jgi:hypothetical protein
MPEPVDSPAPPLRPWRPMAAWTAGAGMQYGRIVRFPEARPGSLGRPAQ